MLVILIMTTTKLFMGKCLNGGELAMKGMSKNGILC